MLYVIHDDERAKSILKFVRAAFYIADPLYLENNLGEPLSTLAGRLIAIEKEYNEAKARSEAHAYPLVGEIEFAEEQYSTRLYRLCEAVRHGWFICYPINPDKGRDAQIAQLERQHGWLVSLKNYVAKNPRSFTARDRIDAEYGYCFLEQRIRQMKEQWAKLEREFKAHEGIEEVS